MIIFSCTQMLSTAFVLCIWGYSNSKQKTSLQSYKTPIKILVYSELAWSGFEEPGPGALLLGSPKSVYDIISLVQTNLRLNCKAIPYLWPKWLKNCKYR